MIRALTVALVIGMSVSAWAEDLVVIAYNVESGGATAEGVSKRLAAIDGCDIWGLSEVNSQDWLDEFEAAAEDGEGANFNAILGTTGGQYGDYLAIIYDADRFTLVEKMELDAINTTGRVRAALVARLKENASGTEFLFMVNHLYRSREGERHKQAELLNQWGAEQTLPVISVGDFNFDWNADNGDTNHDRGYDLKTANGVFEWVRPAKLVKTHDSHYNSVLDFVFVSGAAKNWGKRSTILVEADDYPDDDTTSDHRPVRATFDFSGDPIPGTTTDGVTPVQPPTTADVVTREQLLMQLESLEIEIQELKKMIEKME